MRVLSATFLFVFFILPSCGKNSPLSEDYWNSNTRQDTAGAQRQTDNSQYAIHLRPVVTSLSNIDGAAVVRVQGDAVNTNVQMNNLPSSMVLAHVSFTSLTCANVATNLPPIEVGLVDTKTSSLSETASRNAVIAKVNQAFGRNDSFVNVEGQRMVINAMVMPVQSPLPQTVAIVPIACGDIVREQQSSNTAGGNSTSGNTSGQMAGGTVGGNTTGGFSGGGFTTGGTTGGIGTTTSGGFAGGQIGGASGSITGGDVGSVAGSVGGTTVGSVGGFPGTVGGTPSTVGGSPSTLGGTPSTLGSSMGGFTGTGF